MESINCMINHINFIKIIGFHNKRARNKIKITRMYCCTYTTISDGHHPLYYRLEYCGLGHLFISKIYKNKHDIPDSYHINAPIKIKNFDQFLTQIYEHTNLVLISSSREL